MNGAVESLIGGGAGYVAGQVLHQVSLRNPRKHRETILNSDVEPPKPRHNRLKRLVSEQALVMALAGIASANFIAPNTSVNKVDAGPVLGITNLDFNYNYKHGNLTNQDPAAKLQNEVAASLLNKEGNFHLNAVANGRIQAVDSSSELSAISPYGSSEIVQTAVSNDLSTGFTDAPKERTNLLTTARNEAVSGALVVLDDNASLGSTKGIVQEAAQAGDIPIYIANVSDGVNNGNTASLQAISHETGGHYWNLTPGNVNSVIGSLESSMHVEGSSNESGNPDQYIWLAAAGLALAGEAFVMRRQASEGAIN